MGDALDKIVKLFSKSDDIANKNNSLINTFSFPKIEIPTYEMPSVEVMEFDVENSVPYQIQQQTKEILEKSQEQIELLRTQNKSLCETINTLKEMYDLQQKELSESKKEAKRAKIYNIVMLVIAIVSMLTAIAAWVFPIS